MGRSSKVSTDLMLNLMLRFTIVAYECSLLPCLGAVILLFAVRSSSCLPLRFVLKPLTAGLGMTPLCALWVPLVCGASSAAPDSCSFLLYILKNVICFGIEKADTIEGEVFDIDVGILCKASCPQPGETEVAIDLDVASTVRRAANICCLANESPSC